MKSRLINRRSGLFVALILALSLMSISCGDGAAASDCDAGKIPAPRSAFSIQDGPAAQMANAVTAGVGRVVAATNGGGGRMIIVFEETHASRAGQIEIALMLLRLRKQHKLQQVSLEGAIVGDSGLSPSWFHELTADPASKWAGKQLAVKMLKDGEINSGEFSCLVWPDMQVKGNEKAAEYNVDLSDQAARSVYSYLISLVEKSMTQSQISQVNQLSRAGKNKEAIEFAFGTDPWVKERYDRLTDKGNVTSAEESVKLLQEIEARAKSSGVAIKPEDRSGLQEMTHFFQTAAQRTCTMVANTFAMCDESPGRPVALIIGAAHTPRAMELLKAGGASFAVITPNSLAENSENGTLTTAAYKRKSNKKSVDPAGTLGAYLDRRHKPPVSMGETWYKSKSELGLLATALAAAAAGGEQPPFNSLQDLLKRFRNITVDRSSFGLISKGNEVWAVCNVKANTEGGQVNLSIGGAAPPGSNNRPSMPVSDDDSDDRLERLLKKALDEARQEPPTEAESPNPGPVFVTQLTVDTKIAIAQSADVLKNFITK